MIEIGIPLSSSSSVTSIDPLDTHPDNDFDGLRAHSRSVLFRQSDLPGPTAQAPPQHQSIPSIADHHAATDAVFGHSDGQSRWSTKSPRKPKNLAIDPANVSDWNNGWDELVDQALDSIEI